MATNATRPQSGYDLPVYGLAEGLLYSIHVPALFCIALSLVCVVCTIAWSVHCNWTVGRVRFFHWTQGERNIVYLAVCDGGFNLVHLFDHAQYLWYADHVRPAWLCSLYSFVISEFIAAQHLLVNLIAVSACVTIHRERTVRFGRCDWKLLAYTFGGSLVLDVLCLAVGAYGPTGSFCYFDPVSGVLAHILLSVAPLVIFFSANVIVYILTYRKIYQEEKKHAQVLCQASSTAASSASRAARTSMLFVSAFFVQWWSSVVWGVWQLLEPPPLIMHQFATTFCNIGGVLNFGVFFLLRRSQPTVPAGTAYQT
ncbi:uncharacterized protein LOC119102964 [Pollicipes pollicipes]|uniref:uncharacterized protein LOC119102964 n=1 Tax=Pollicipes pollicipes TaxID=41117 RepID=UPI0018855EFD|nr:uncharacterized protein LOC119102964 [Pollicipes pollicipes]